jgi:hypothetical protein
MRYSKCVVIMSVNLNTQQKCFFFVFVAENNNFQVFLFLDKLLATDKKSKRSSYLEAVSEGSLNFELPPMPPKVQ